MRLFIAVSFSDETKSRLAALREELQGKSARGNFSAIDNLHLTLAFLGECDARQLTAVKAVLDSLIVEPMDICIDRIERFRRDGGDIWWAGIADCKTLISLQQDLTDKLISVGFRLESRKYSPHITLAREVITEAQPFQIEPFGEIIRSVDLMKSERINGKLTYTTVHRKES